MTLTTSPADTLATSHALVSWSTITTATATPPNTSQCAGDRAAVVVPTVPPASPTGAPLTPGPVGVEARS